MHMYKGWTSTDYQYQINISTSSHSLLTHNVAQQTRQYVVIQDTLLDVATMPPLNIQHLQLVSTLHVASGIHCLQFSQKEL